VPPEFTPANAGDAARIAVTMASARYFSPPVFCEVTRAAIARGDLPLVGQLDKLGRSMAGTPMEPGFVAAFVNSQAVFDVLQEAGAALATPDVIRSDAASEWLGLAERDVRYFVATLREGHGRIDPMQFTAGAVEMLFPDRVPPGQRPLGTDLADSLR
jgi:hypothetical protein